jgi:hypothetical protein
MDLINCGANVCVCGDDMLVHEGSERFADVGGLGGHCENQLQIVISQALLRLTRVISVFHHTAFLGKIKTIMSCPQMEHYVAENNDKSLQ